MMEKKVLSAREVQERRFLLRAPLLGVPLLTVLFWAFGGGRGLAEVGSGPTVKGFNMQVPGPKLAHRGELNKLDYYAQAEKDSAEARQKRKMEDSYARQLGLEEEEDSMDVAAPVRRVGFSGEAAHGIGHSGSVVRLGGHERMGGRGLPGGTEHLEEVARVARTARGKWPAVANDPVVSKVQEQLDALSRTLNRSTPAVTLPALTGKSVAGNEVGRAADVERLERLMGALTKRENNNPELEQLSGLLERVAALQGGHADSGRLVVRGTPSTRVEVIVAAVPDAVDSMRGDSSMIPAVVPEEQSLVSGEELRLELAGDVRVGNKLVPAGTPVYGVAQLSGERLRVTIPSIASDQHLFPVGLQVFDQDGLAGIHIPGAPVSDALRELSGQELGSFGPTVLTTTMAGQAAGAGMQMARSLIGRRTRQVRVTVPEGYRVLLHVENGRL